MGFEFVITVEMPDGTMKQFLTDEPYIIGEFKNGVARNPLPLGGGC